MDYCKPPVYVSREIDVTKWDGSATEKIVTADIQEPIYAISIGPESDIDRCWIFGADGVPPILPPTRDSQARTAPVFRNGIKISVESPYVGYIEPQGPLRILLPYARASLALAGALGRFTPINGATEWDRAMYGLRNDEISEGQPGMNPLLQLVFHRMPVSWLPRHRTPMEWVFNVDAWSAIGAPVSHVARVPGFGRHRLTLSMKMKDYTAGSLDWSFVGVNVADAGAAFDEQIHRETLEAQTAIAADFDETYLFDGEFDYYELTVTEATALGAGTDLQAIIKAWDR